MTEPVEQRRRVDPLRVVTSCLLTLVTVAVVTLIVYLVTYVQEQRRLSECYRASFNELNSSLATTVGAAGQDRRELRALVTSLTDPSRTRAERQAALDDYLRQLDASEAARAGNPLPSRAC